MGNNSGVLGRSLGQGIERSGLFATLLLFIANREGIQRYVCLLTHATGLKERRKSLELFTGNKLFLCIHVYIMYECMCEVAYVLYILRF